MSDKKSRKEGSGAFHLIDRLSPVNSPSAEESAVKPKKKSAPKQQNALDQAASVKVQHYYCNPDRVVLWKLANRSYYDPGVIETIKESIKKSGQYQPALVRPIPADSEHYGSGEYDFELIYGAQRLHAVKQLGLDLLAEVRDLDDRAAALAMDVENRVRSDITVYDRACDYARWLEEGVFASAADICREAGLSPGQMSKLLHMAALPEEVADAFVSPYQLSLVFGYELARKLSESEDIEKSKQSLIREAVRMSDAAESELSLPERQRRLLKSMNLSESRRRASRSVVFNVPARDIVTASGQRMGRLTVTRAGEVQLRTRRLTSEAHALSVLENLQETLAPLLEMSASDDESE